MPRVVVNPRVFISASDEGYLAYDPSSDRLHRLNPTAALLIELAVTPRDAGELCALVAPLLGDESALACQAWVDGALRDGLLLPHDNQDTATDVPDARAWERRARELRDRGQVLAAYVCQSAAVSKAPKRASAWHHLGELAHIVGRRDEARRAYERYSEMRPYDAEIAHILTSLRDATPPPRAPDRCVEQLYARFASFYEENMCGDLDYQAPQRLDDALAVELCGRRELKVVELGCGTGLAGQLLRQHARHLLGVDLSAAMIKRAVRTGIYDALEVAEITAWLRRSPDTFDLVAACDTLIYFGDLRQVVVPAAQHLASGGLIAFTIERGTEYPFRLTDSGRYAHHRDHIEDVARDTSLSVRRVDDAVLRYEYGEPVAGLVVVLG